MKTGEIDGAIEALSYIPADLPYQEWHKALRAGVAADIPFEELDRWSATGGDKYKGTEDVRATIKRIRPDGGTGPGTLYFMAKEYGYRPPGKQEAKSQNSYPSPTFPGQSPFPNTSQRLAELAESCEPATASHPYIQRKLGLPEGLLVYRGNKPVDGRNCEGALVLPLCKLDGTPASFQLIPQVGKKKYFLKDVSLPKEACMVVGGELKHGQKVYVVEGVGQAWSAHQATRVPAVVCFGKGRMAGVAKAIHARYPNLVLVIVPDAGGQKEAPKVAQAVGGLYVDVPADWQANYDINDLHVETHRLAEVAALLESAKAPLIDEERNGVLHEGNALNDVGNAWRLVKRCGQDVRWLPDTKEWITWNGHRWLVDQDGAVMRLAKATAQSIYREAAEEKDAEKARQIARWAHCSHSMPRLQAMIELTKSERHISLASSRLDTEDMLLGTPSGVVDLKTGSIVAPVRQHYITKTTKAVFDRVAVCPRWEQFLNECFNGIAEKIKFMQRLFGYCLTGSTREQVMFILLGSGANGKSVLLETARMVLGDYGMQAPPDMLMQSNGDRATNDIARLRGARLVVAMEVDEGRRLAETQIKQLTGGDQVCVRPLYKDFSEHRPTYKLVLGANHIPLTRGNDPAMERRIILVTFDVTIPEKQRDKDLSVKLAAESAGILQWMIRGCLDYQRDGLCPPQEIIQSTNAYRAQMDTFADWLENCCAVVREGKARGQAAYHNYVHWTQLNGYRPLSQTAFSQKLIERGFIKEKKPYGFIYCGLVLQTDDHAPAAPAAPSSETYGYRRNI